MSSVPDRLTDTITRDNALDLLADAACPECGTLGAFELFSESNNNGVGIICSACAKRHPFGKHRIMWLRQDDQRKPNNIEAVMRECGFYCYGCGTDVQILRARGIGISVHHTRPFADYGESVKKIPLCALCHELLSAAQRHHNRLLTK